MSSKIKIIFILPSLRAGGAERVMSFIASSLNKKKFETSLLITGSEQDQAYTISEETPITFLNKSQVRYALPSIAIHLVRKKPHIVIGAIGHINFALSILALFFKKTIFIGRETYVLGYNLDSRKNKKKQIHLPDLRPLTLDKIVCQSKDMKNDLITNFSYPANKIVTINNPVTKNFLLKNKKYKNNLTHFITVGRLNKQKGHLRILDALTQLKTPFRYTILGDGPEKRKIFEHAKNLNLTKYISHIPYSDKVEDYLAESDLFLCGSYVEGFPNALLESCAVGTPVLAYEAPGGLNEIIVDGINGYLAKDKADFLLKLNISLTQSWNPGIIRQTVMSKFREELILEQYENLFLSFSENYFEETNGK